MREKRSRRAKWVSSPAADRIRCAAISAVQNIACVAMPDPDLGEKTCACVILRPGRSLALEELTRFLSEKEIAKFKLPERLEILPEFPLSTFGKVSKKALVEMVTKKLGEERVRP